MQLQLKCYQSMDLSLRCESEYMDTIFPLTGMVLNTGDAFKALKFVAANKKMESYRSVIDFLFCEVAGSPWRNRCMSYYAGQGLQLRYVLSQPEIERWDRILVHVLDYAIRCLNAERYLTWTQFRYQSYIPIR